MIVSGAVEIEAGGVEFAAGVGETVGGRCVLTQLYVENARKNILSPLGDLRPLVSEEV